MRKALIIGINDYPNARLDSCISDASAFANVIGTHSDGSPNFGVRLETNVQKKSELNNLIIELFQGKNDVALLYFSGHGALDETGGYIVTPDYEKNDVGISMDYILNLVNQSETKDKIIILDCCHSGQMGSPKTSYGTSQIKEGVTILTASRDVESAIEVNGHGLFTNLLLGALQGGASDLRGHVTPGSIYAYIDQALGPWEQRPVFKTNVTRFTVLRNVTEPIQINILRKITEYFQLPEYVYPLNPSYEYTKKKQAIKKNVEIFKNLQKMERVGLVVPVEEEHMYYAAIRSKSCKLTALGAHYWRLVKEERV